MAMEWTKVLFLLRKRICRDALIVPALAISAFGGFCLVTQDIVALDVCYNWVHYEGVLGFTL